MEREVYKVERGEEDFVYWFYSEGLRGSIRKIVRFQPTPEFGRNVFNLSFGDWNSITREIDDQVVSNNGDQLKVLKTVAKAVVDFVNFWPDAIIRVKGSTPSRTRLYQMGMASFWLEINMGFEIWGEVGNDWFPFEKGVNYNRFLIFKKIE